MKTFVTGTCLMAAIFLATACGGNSDSTSTDTGVIANTPDTQMSKMDKMQDTVQPSAMAASPANDADMDKAFATEAAGGGMMEVEMGKLAENNGASAKVKEFGKLMVNDHTKANNELKSLAARKNITLPATLDSKMQEHLSEMKAMKGADFDKAYVSMMVNDHKTDVGKFEDEMSKTKDADFKAFTTKTLPVLRTHMEKINAIQAGMK